MAQTAANLIQVLPEVPLRQFVLTLPFDLRRRLAYDGELLAATSRTFVGSVLDWYRRRMELEGARGGRSGAILVIQRTSSDLRTNPHFHSVLLDGVLTEQAGELTFHALPRLRTLEVAEILQIVRVRILRLLVRRGVLAGMPEPTVLNDDSWRPRDDPAEQQSALAQLTISALFGHPPAGPELRRRHTMAVLSGGEGVTITSPLSVCEGGFSLHAATHAGGRDERAREALIKYILRPPIANERLRMLANDLVRIELRKPFRDGTVAVDMDPLSLLVRLCAAVPSPRRHTVVYSGVLASASRWRARLKGTTRTPEPPTAPAPAPPFAPPDDPPRSTGRFRYWPYLELLERTFGIDRRNCGHCGGKMKLHALVQDSQSIARILRHVGEPTEVPAVSEARAPPYWKSRILRQRSTGQADLFEA